LKIAGQFIGRAKTGASPQATVDVPSKVRVIGRQCATGFKETMKMLFDAHPPMWNHRVIPESG